MTKHELSRSREKLHVIAKRESKESTEMVLAYIATMLLYCEDKLRSIEEALAR